MLQPTRRLHGLLLALAVFLAASSTLFSIVWMAAVRWHPTALLGIDFDYVLEESCLSIEDVAAGSAADRAGVQPGDRIVAINGRSLASYEPVLEELSAGAPGSTVRLEILRGRSREPLTLVARLDPYPARDDPTPPRRLANELMGLFPLPFLIVGFTVLFLRLFDPHAWLLALMLSGIIGGAPLVENLPGIPEDLRGFAFAYQALFAATNGGLIYFFFAVFPVHSPIERRLPWLKWILLLPLVILALPLAYWIVRSNSPHPLYVVDRFLSVQHPNLGRLRIVLGFGSIILGILSLLMNTWRGPTAEVRRKTRVILWGMVVGILPFLTLQGVGIATDRSFYEFPYWLWAPCVLAVYLLPLSLAYAVLKHRVLEIPVLLRRSARYLLVQRGFVVVIILAGAALVLSAATLLVRAMGDVDSPSRAMAVGVVAALLAVAMTWSLARLHGRISRRIDRAFFRNAYDARQILEDLILHSRQARSPRELMQLLQGNLREALQPQSLHLYRRQGMHLVATPSNPHTSPSAWRSPSSAVPSPASTPLLTTLLLEALEQQGSALDDTVENFGALLAGSGLEDTGVECLVPILERQGRLTGLLALGPRRSEEPYSGEDKRLLAGVAAQAGITLESFTLAEEIAQKLEGERRVAYEMEIAHKVQNHLFPHQALPLDNLEYGARCVQARAVGGDFYDYLNLGPRRLGLVLADISGKGISAALLMANLQATLRSRAVDLIRDLDGVMLEINRSLFVSTEAQQFATLFYMEYDDGTRSARYVNCGHNPPLCLRRDGTVEALPATATLLGAFEPWECEVAELSLQSGDVLLAYSDGVTETRSRQGELFGETRLIEVLRAHRHAAVADILQAVTSAVGRFGANGPEDDLTLLVARAR